MLMWAVLNFLNILQPWKQELEVPMLYSLYLIYNLISHWKAIYAITITQNAH